MVQRNQKDPWLAVFLSKVFPGAGHIYGGEIARGYLFVAATIALIVTVYMCMSGFLMTGDAQRARTYAVVSLMALFIMAALSLYVLFDAYKVVKHQERDDLQTVAAAGERKPWLAALLSSFIPGVGQFYNRQIIKGLAFLALAIVGGALEDDYAPLVVVGLLVYVFCIKDAYDSAERTNGSSGRFLQQEKAVLLFMMIMFSLESIPFANNIKEHVVEAFKIPASSMKPTLLVGDHMLLGKLRMFTEPLKRGDVVVFPSPEDPAKNFVKRVVGLGGDKVQFINGDLYMNDRMVPAKLIGVRTAEGSPINTYGPPTEFEEQVGDAVYRVHYLRDRTATNAGPWLVPDDSVFVLGDNRDNSMDSRIWGPVKREGIKGKAMKIYWSWDREDSRVRWERIGETIH